MTSSVLYTCLQEFECNAEDLKELKELGHGAYGFVYKMIHEPTGNIMAVKVMSDSGQFYYRPQSRYLKSRASWSTSIGLVQKHYVTGQINQI